MSEYKDGRGDYYIAAGKRDEKYDATHKAAITPGVALWAAVSFSTGIRLTDEQVERALRSLETNNWRLVGPEPRRRYRYIGGEGEAGESSGLPPED